MKSMFKETLPFLFLAMIILLLRGSPLNFWLAIFVFFQSILLFFLTAEEVKAFPLRKSIMAILPILIGLFVLVCGVYKDTFKLTNLEKNQLWTREEMYRRELGFFGRISFGNRFIEDTKLVHDKVTQKITESYELNRYFSSEPSSFYAVFLLPFFVLGFLSMLAEKIKPTLYYLGLATVAAILVPQDMTYWLFIPIINLGIFFGIKKLASFLKINSQ